MRKLKGRRLCRKEKFEVFAEALETVWSRDEVERLRKSLGEWRSRLVLLTVSALRELHTQRGCQVPLPQSIMVQNSKNGQRFLKCLEQNAEYFSQIQEKIRASPRPVGEVFTLASSDEFETGILSALWFAEMQHQGDQIREPCQGTFQWIFRERRPDEVRWASFVDWLRKDSDQHIYWITGKAGAGKSTLLKFICNHEYTDKLGREWAASDRLIHAQCYVDNRDVSLQASRKRLLRTLLHRCLSQDERLIARTFPVQWEMFTLLGIPPDSPMTELDLQQALERMIKCNLDTRFLFFVDGIDELEESNSLVALFKKPPLYPNIKLCLSSRPRANSRDGSGLGPSLCLEELNCSDIIQFTEASLEKSTGFIHLRAVSPIQTQALVHAIADKAAGVFLWARIVVSMLLQGLEDGERLSDLRRRLESAPGDLEPLFEKMLDSIGPERIEHASQIFEIIQAAKTPVDLLSLSFADEEDETLPYDYPIEPLTQAQEDARADQMRRRLHTHCKGLLDVSPNTTVHHLHHTVRDFLHRPEIWTRLTSPQPPRNPPFNPHLSLAHASLLRLKSARFTPSQHRTHSLLPHLPPPGTLAALVLTAVHHLSALDRLTRAFHADLWDALARATQALVERGGRCSAAACWCRGAADHPDGPFLPLAVRCRAVPYVAERLERTWARVSAGRVEGGAAGVLSFAVAPAVRPGEGAGEDDGDEDEERARLVRMLLEWGADPNFKAGAGRSPWEEVVEGGGVEEYGVEVWGEMLRYGADRKVVGSARGFVESSGVRAKKKRRWIRRVWRREDGRMRWERRG